VRELTKLAYVCALKCAHINSVFMLFCSLSFSQEKRRIQLKPTVSLTYSLLCREGKCVKSYQCVIGIALNICMYNSFTQFKSITHTHTHSV